MFSMRNIFNSLLYPRTYKYLSSAETNNDTNFFLKSNTYSVIKFFISIETIVY
jgi:hypothetical protein